MADDFLGIDLCGPAWIAVRARLSGALAPSRTERVTVPEWKGAAMLDALEDALTVRTDHELGRPENAAPAALRKVLTPAGQHYLRALQPNNIQGTSVAVCFPFRTAPIIRRFLPLLFGVRDLPLVTSGPSVPNYGVEAPVALLLQAVAEHDEWKNALPDRFLLLTGPPGSAELTAAEVVRETAPEPDVRQILRFTLTRSAEYRPETHADVFPPFRALIGDKPERWRLCHAGEALAGDAGRIARDAGFPDPGTQIVPLDDQALALGAIRHAGLVQKQLVLGSHLMSRLAGTSVASAPLGILGTNSSADKPEWFWRRLIEAGTPLPTAPRAILAPSSPSKNLRYLGLAECGDPGHHSRLWLHQKEFARARLRWHEVPGFKPGEDRSTGQDAWSFTLNDRSWADRWGGPRWSVTFLRAAPPPSAATS